MALSEVRARVQNKIVERFQRAAAHAFRSQVISA